MSAPKDPYQHWIGTPSTPTKYHALPAGEWVTGKGGVRRYVPDSTSFDTLEREGERRLLERIGHNLAADMTLPKIVRKKATCCTDCGCLIFPDEACPGCLAWAERVSVSASWRMVETHYGTRTKVAA